MGRRRLDLSGSGDEQVASSCGHGNDFSDCIERWKILDRDPTVFSKSTLLHGVSNLVEYA